jgi:hypothetical protein
MWFGVVEASTLGWTQTVNQLATEVRNVCALLVILGIVIFAVEIAITRHFDRLGQGLAAFSIAGALITTAVATAAALTGGGALGAPVTEAVVVLSRLEGANDLVAALAPPGLMAWGAAWSWMRLRYGR